MSFLLGTSGQCSRRGAAPERPPRPCLLKPPARQRGPVRDRARQTSCWCSFFNQESLCRHPAEISRSVPRALAPDERSLRAPPGARKARGCWFQLVLCCDGARATAAAAALLRARARCAPAPADAGARALRHWLREAERKAAAAKLGGFSLAIGAPAPSPAQQSPRLRGATLFLALRRGSLQQQAQPSARCGRAGCRSKHSGASG